jgi:hypothetical protein
MPSTKRSCGIAAVMEVVRRPPLVVFCLENTTPAPWFQRR